MTVVAEKLFSSSLAWLRSRRHTLSLLVLAGLCPFCHGQLPTDLALPSETINSGNPVFQASNSITNSADLLVQDSASVALAAGSYIRLEPGFDAVAGSAPFTFFAVINPNLTQWPPNQGDGPPSIPSSYTALDHSPTCDNISGQWIDSDNVGNSIGWDLNQSGPSVTGTLSFDDYRNFGAGLTYCGRISYSASGSYSGNGSYSLAAANPVPSIDNCGLPLAPSEAEAVTLSGQACGSGAGTYIISGGGGTQGLSRAAPSSTGAGNGYAMNATALPAAASGSSTWTTYSPRFNVSYASYIPVDNITGPRPCFYSLAGELPALSPLLYKGDANRGTYRTTQAIFVVPDKQYDGNFFPETGATRNYGFGSPANGPNSNLSSYPTGSDIYDGPYAGADEDNNPGDCRFWNAKGHATTVDMQSHSVTFPNSHQAVVSLSGLGRDPLELQLGGIQWNATITLDTTDPSHPTAQATISHTCYPAHIVKVNGVTLLDDLPKDNETYTTVIPCLTDFLPWTTTTSPVKQVPSY